jgi:hypothetical protein
MTEDRKKDSKMNFSIGLVAGIIGYKLIFDHIIPWITG